jgi:long-subunit fatty acid transport protein
MGNAYTGVANDYSAIYWNPAGLVQLEHGEFSIGLSNLNYKDASAFFGAGQDYSLNSTNLNAVGLVYPVPTRRGSLAIAFGYTRQSDFTTGVSFQGFNPGSSIIQTYARDGSAYPSDLSGNLAYQLYLANIDTVTGRFDSPITGRLTQLGTVIEGAGLNNWSISAGVDIARNLSAGATLTFLSGSYKYDRTYKEQDNANVYSVIPFDFSELVITDNIQSDISGVNGKIGLMYRDPGRFRFGITVKTPTSLQIKETFSTSATSHFDNVDASGNQDYGPFDSPGSDEYDVVTPWVFGAGASVIIRDLMLSGDIEYTDWTQLEFRNANADVIAENQIIRTLFVATYNLRAGAEYDLENAGVRLRAGFIYNPSPFRGDPSSFDQKYITAGLGFVLGESSMLDLAYARGWWNTFRSNYDETSQVNEKVTTNTFLLTFSYRF